MAIDITTIGATGTHSFKKVNVNAEDDYIYFKNNDIPSQILNGSTYIYAGGIGSIQGIGDGSLVYIDIANDKTLKFVDENDNDLDITGAVDGGITLNDPVVLDNKLSINVSTPSNQAVKYYTTGDPLTGLTNGETYFLKNVSADFIGAQALYEIEK